MPSLRSRQNSLNKTKAGEEAFAEIADTRYGIIFTGEKRAKGQHVTFQRKPVPRIKHSDRSADQPSLLPEEKLELFPEPVLTFAPEEEQLVSKLVRFGVGETKARSLVKRHREATEAQIAAYPYRV